MTTSGAGKKGQATPQMNVTPLVDVVLVLLIIFMVVTPLLSKQMWLNLPKKDDTNAPPPPDDTSIVLSVDRAGVMRVNRVEMSEAELPERLRRLLAAKDQKVVFFDADDEAPYAATVHAMDLAKAGGATNIAILTEKIQ